MTDAHELSRTTRRRRQIICIGSLMALTVADAAYAQAGGGGAFAPLSMAFQMIVDFITGPFGRLIAIIAVITLGFLAFQGRLSWFFAGSVILGIGFVFGAPNIVDQLISAVGQ